METNEKVYASQQLICMLPPLALKVMLYLLNWQRMEQIKYYEKQMCKFMHIEKEELQLAIQTLEDNKLIDISMIDQTWMITINKETVKKYFNVKMETIAEHSGIQMAKAITWNQVDESKSNDIDEMSEEEMKRMVLMLQARLKEKTEVKKVVVTNDVVDDYGLPF